MKASMFLVQHNGSGEIEAGLVHFTLRQENEAASHHGLGVARRHRSTSSKSAGPGQFAELIVSHGPVVPRGGVMRIKLDRLVIIADRLLKLSLGRVLHAPVVIKLGVRAYLDGCGVIGDAVILATAVILIGAGDRPPDPRGSRPRRPTTPPRCIFFRLHRRDDRQQRLRRATVFAVSRTPGQSN